jgi:hypothetical protein
MKKIDMGCYYFSDKGLVRTVARATDVETKKSMIMFVNIESGGCASQPLLISEERFAATYIK